MKFKHQRQHQHTAHDPLKRSGSKWIVMEDGKEVSERLTIYAAKRLQRARKQQVKICNV